MFEELYQRFEIIVFTAANKIYSDMILDVLDPEGKFIQHRVYRESCVKTPTFYIKDLRVIANEDRPLQSMILVDNTMASFCYQINTGVPITPFIDCKQDEELKRLIPYLKILEEQTIQDVN